MQIYCFTLAICVNFGIIADSSKKYMSEIKGTYIGYEVRRD